MSHAHKYWCHSWQACYNNGKGRFFGDDRGFDTSVKGHVLGVVVPIMDKQEVIGDLKFISEDVASLIKESSDGASRVKDIVQNSTSH